MQERLEAVVAGRVQGVMFRDFTCRKAQALGLVGEVRNMSDGRVSVVAEGEKVQLEKFLRYLEEGPLLASVKNVEARWQPGTGTFRSFKLCYV